MINHKVANMISRLEALIIISIFLLIPIAGHAQDFQMTPVQKTAPVKLNPTINPQQARVAGYKQPLCTGAPLPDIDAKDLRIEGSGKHGQPHRVKLIIVNHGQCETGKFSIKASMRIQGQGIDEIVQLGSRGAPSLKPCKSETCSEASHSVAFKFTPQYNHALYDITVDARLMVQLRV